MKADSFKTSETWIVGYGNRYRKDDGIGPYVAEELYPLLKHRKGIHIQGLPQLDVALLEDLKNADLLILVDATMVELAQGWKWIEIEPALEELPHWTHHVAPPLFLGMLQSIYHRFPRTRLISVQGEDFEFGEGLTRKAAMRAKKAISGIMDFLNEKGMKDADDYIQNHRKEV